SPLSIYAADLDNDGDIDVLYSEASQIGWYENNGNGSFSEQQTLAITTMDINSLYTVDLDNDGDIDMVSFSQWGIIWHENDGNGNFGTQQIITTMITIYGISYVSDLDNDGDIDAMLVSPWDNKITWYENNGSGNFGEEQFIAMTTSPLSIYAADLDNDGDVDILYSEAGQIVWQENLLNNPRISGTVFYDTNQNGTMDNSEFGVDYQNVALSPTATYAYANNNGLFIYYYETAGTYTLNYTPPTNWTATTPTTIIVNIASGQTSTNNNFGIYPATFFTDIQPYITSGINRCNWTVPYYLTVINEGTTISPVSVVSLNPDERLTYVNANPAPDSIDTQGNLYWHIYNLLPTQQQQYIIDFQMPDFSAMGDTLSTVAAVYTY
ncbi:MAG TPA: VCBS repeat-containing protein, partial [Chitinophagales bacterium]|nr:VCBS repeat-containing protein [Chitinophagales bacterium]